MREKELVKLRKKVYQLLKVNDATNKVSWWNLSDDVVDLIESERERVVGEMEKALVDSFPAFPNEKTKQMIKMFNSFWKLALKKINKLKKKG